MNECEQMSISEQQIEKKVCRKNIDKGLKKAEDWLRRAKEWANQLPEDGLEVQ